MTTQTESSPESNQPAVAAPQATAPKIEIGWIIAGQPDAAAADAIRQARSDVLESLNATFPEFLWRAPLVRRPESTRETRIEPVALLDQGTEERETRRWDFAVVITPADLIGHYKPFSLAIVSRLHDTSVISTARIDALSVDVAEDRDKRIATLARRIKALVFHTVGHLWGLNHDPESSNWMCDIQTVGDLDPLANWNAEQIERTRENLREIADVRLEEQSTRPSSLRFYAQSAWINRHEIYDAVREARPWEFPARLSRLTTAAVSAAVILMLTAETWELALNQSAATIAGLMSGALLLTTVYVVQRQQLLVRRAPPRLSEQWVITNVSTLAIVLGGMITSIVSLFVLILVVGRLLFRPSLVAAWADGPPAHIGWGHYLFIAAFVSSVSIVIGALGASFEEQHYFRHVTFVDEEV